tara:strand:- start:189 stop:419 length:231 start_codon:yes stop_codon:yes gene_type:complete
LIPGENRDGNGGMIYAPVLYSEDRRLVTDAYAGELERGQARRAALNYATAVYLQRHPFLAVGEARAMIRAALGEKA